MSLLGEKFSMRGRQTINMISIKHPKKQTETTRRVRVHG
jgi:hypothetical protein